MPELPEVETVKRVLEPQLKGRTIAAVALGRPEVVAHPGPEAFARLATGARIGGVGRRGKFLLLDLAERGTLAVHLRMTGQLWVAPPGCPPERHTHAVLSLDDGNELRFTDLRRFGRLWLLEPGEADAFSGIGKLGMEPFDDALTAEFLRGALGKSRRAIKACLLDQRVVAGIGNIYSDEILHAARLRPGRPACSLDAEEWQALTAAIPAVLEKAIAENATTAEEYLASRGGEYRNAPFFQVYGRAGQPCPRCGAALERTVLAGRGSCFCPACQR